MKVGVPKERAAGERRVALVPDAVSRLSANGVEVVVEAGAGAEASFADAAYAQVGAAIARERGEIYASADLVCKVQKPSADEV